MRRLHSLLADEVLRRGFGRVDSPLLSGADDPWPIARDASHHMGTTRMGDDRSTSVVDRYCRVHGIENLFVAGSSVFPTSGSANPTLTIVALAYGWGITWARPRLGDDRASPASSRGCSGSSWSRTGSRASADDASQRIGRSPSRSREPADRRVPPAR